jgi:hypothetical protein
MNEKENEPAKQTEAGVRLKVAFDVDGVLLNYNQQMALMIKKALGLELALVDPLAHHFKAAYGYELTGTDREKVYDFFDAEGWKTMPAEPGAVEALALLDKAKHELVCISSMPKRFEACRLHNLRSLGMRVAKVIGTGRETESTVNPKAEHVEREAPDVFVDDQLRNLNGLPGTVFKVWIDTGRNDGPNVGADLGVADAIFPSALSFAQALVAHPERFKKPKAALKSRMAP